MVIRAIQVILTDTSAEQNKIETSFPRKGRAGKEEESKRKIRHELARGRATSMEGSFGTQKEHYGLHRVKAD